MKVLILTPWIFHHCCAGALCDIKDDECLHNLKVKALQCLGLMAADAENSELCDLNSDIAAGKIEVILNKYLFYSVSFSRDSQPLQNDSLLVKNISGSTLYVFTRARDDFVEKAASQAAHSLPYVTEEEEGVTWSRYNSFSLSSVFDHLDQEEKREVALEYIDMYAKELLQSTYMLNLNSSVLALILERDSLSVEEVMVFKFLMRWGSSMSELTGTPVKELISPLLPMVRFSAMSSSALATVVQPTGVLSNEKLLKLYELVGLGQQGNTRRKGRMRPLEFRWDPQVNANEVKYSHDNTVVIKHGPTDISISRGDCTFSSGRHWWQVKVHAKEDELWIGVTDLKALAESVKGGDIRNHARIWCYCDGSRRNMSFQCAGRIMPRIPEPYGAGDTIGVLLDCDAGVMSVFKNGKLQSVCDTLPKHVDYWPIVALDAPGDKVELLLF